MPEPVSDDGRPDGGDWLHYHPLVPSWLDTSPRLIAAMVLVGWLPGALLALAEGVFWPRGDMLTHSYLLDPLVLAILTVLPVGVVLGRHFETNLNQTLRALDNAGILPPERQPLDRALALANRVQTSRGVLVIVAILAVLAGLPLLASHVFDDLPTWWGSGGMPTLAGLWFTLVLNAFLLYVLYAWGLRGALWAWVTIAVSRCELRLNPTHPDRCCGLMLFSRSATRWAIMVAATGLVLAAHIGSTVYLRDLPLVRPDVVLQVSVYFVLGPIVSVVPLLSFTPRLLRERRRAELSLSYFASGYARALRAKIREPGDDPLELNASISGLADLYAVYENVTTLRLAPMDLRRLVRIGAFLVGPFVPLVLPEVQRVLIAWLQAG